jgi:hypothetical protein
MESEPMLAGAVISAILAAWHGLWQHIADEAAVVRTGRRASAASAWVLVEHDETLFAEPHLTLNGLLASGSIEGQSWQWQAGQAVLTLSKAAPRHIEVLFTAPQRFSASGPLGRASAVLWAENLRASLDLHQDGQVAKVALSGDGLTLIGPDFEIGAAEARLSSDDVGSGMLRLELALATVSPPATWRLGPPLDGPIDSASVIGWIEGTGPPLPRHAAAWREAGGVLGIGGFDLAWGPVAMHGNGRANLDAALKPEGRGRLTLSGLDDALNAAAARALISPSWHQAVSTAFERLAKLRGDTDAQDITARLSMASGVLRWAGLPLAVLPALGCSETASC